MDEWAGGHAAATVFAQIGATDLEPRHMEWSQFLEPAEFRARIESARVVVSHAGMGTILTALEFGVPIVVMPRRGDLREHRNDHQLATAERFAALGRIASAADPIELAAHLARLDAIGAAAPIAGHAGAELLDALRRFVDAG
jgi:UDP-N-acetylglucosamine transferase subunit ALG13